MTAAIRHLPGPTGAGGTAAAAPLECVTEALAPVKSAIAAIRPSGRSGVLLGPWAGRADPDTGDWVPAAELLAGRELDRMLVAAGRRWNAPPHVAAALVWKCYTYWVALPAVVGYGVARRVPLPRPADVHLRFLPRNPVITVAIPRPTVAALKGDPLVGQAGRPDPPGLAVVPDRAALLAALRTALVDDHLSPLLDALRGRVRLGRRTLLGSLASGVAYGVSRVAADLVDPAQATAADLLDALDLADLVDLTPLPSGELGIQRQTCCLAFALPHPRICGGCCIRR